MRSIFHVEANTPEELREQLIHYLEDELDRVGRAGLVSNRLVRDRLATAAELIAIKRILSFWREIIIDGRNSDDP